MRLKEGVRTDHLGAKRLQKEGAASVVVGAQTGSFIFGVRTDLFWKCLPQTHLQTVLLSLEATQRSRSRGS